MIKIQTWRCGHAASSVGSSSSGSNSAPVGFDDGGKVLNIFTANWRQRKALILRYIPQLSFSHD